jgi:transposase
VLSIPGWGPVVTATVFGELGDLARFQDPRQALKMAGLNLTHESSGHHHGRTHISQRGRPGVRAVLYQAAAVAIANDPAWRA